MASDINPTRQRGETPCVSSLTRRVLMCRRALARGYSDRCAEPDARAVPADFRKPPFERWRFKVTLGVEMRMPVRRAIRLHLRADR